MIWWLVLQLLLFAFSQLFSFLSSDYQYFPLADILTERIPSKPNCICNFADDNTFCSCSQDLQTVIENLTYDVKNVLTWFKINSMKTNPEKFQFIILSKTRRPEYNLLIDSNVIKESADVELLGLIVDNKLSFEKHFAKLCQTASHKLLALRQIRKYLTLEKARVLGNTFVDFQFNYEPLIWIFCKKAIYFKMQKIHHRTLRIIYHSDESNKNLLNLDNSVSLHQRHLRILVTEIFKSVSKIIPSLCGPILVVKTYHII